MLSIDSLASTNKRIVVIVLLLYNVTDVIELIPTFGKAALVMFLLVVKHGVASLVLAVVPR